MDTLAQRSGLPVVMAVLVVAATAVVAVLVARDPRRRERLPMILLLGSVAVVLAATALPHGWPPALASDGDLVLRPGGGGLRDLPVLWDDPRSLAALLLVLNVVLYVPVGAFARLALPDHGARALLIPLVLSVAVEAWQFVGLGRVGSLDDVLLNLVGATVGWFAARLVTDARGGSHLVGQDGRPTT